MKSAVLCLNNLLHRDLNMKIRLLLTLLLFNQMAYSTEYKVVGDNLDNFGVGDIQIGKPLPNHYFDKDSRHIDGIAFIIGEQFCTNPFKDRINNQNKAEVTAVTNWLRLIQKQGYNHSYEVDKSVPFKEPLYKRMLIQESFLNHNVRHIEVYYHDTTKAVIGLSATVQYSYSVDEVSQALVKRFGNPKQTLQTKRNKSFYFYDFPSFSTQKDKIEEGTRPIVFPMYWDQKSDKVDSNFLISLYRNDDSITSVQYWAFHGVKEVYNVSEANIALCKSTLENIVGQSVGLEL
ncbi:hypothetical protein RZY46_003102 [Vibrio alginolyticus]|nr:hypothetical protein [Vibrio alginolyticus]